MKLTEKQKEMLQDAADNLGADLRTDYSGRGMFGRECVGFDTSRGALNFGLDLAKELVVHGKDGMELLDELGTGREDNMGRDYIYYFPDIQWS